MGHEGHEGGIGMALGMLAHMPWYHYLLMVVVILTLAVLVHLRIRRKYWPQHATMQGIARSTIEHAVILLCVEAVSVIVVVGGVSGGMVAYHMSQMG